MLNMLLQLQIFKIFASLAFYAKLTYKKCLTLRGEFAIFKFWLDEQNLTAL